MNTALSQQSIRWLKQMSRRLIGRPATDKVLYLSRCCPEKALENLNRLTGLQFDSYPDSLLEYCTVPCPREATPTGWRNSYKG